MKIIKKIFYILILLMGIYLLIAAYHNQNDLYSLIGGIIFTIWGTYKNHSLIKKIDKLDF
jgi:uncharacterized membrane protein